MQSQTRGLNINMPNLIKAAPVPLIATVVMGLLSLLSIRLGVLSGIIFTLLWAFCGAWYAREILRSGERTLAIDLALNGAVLGIAAAIIYSIIVWLAAALRSNGYTLDVVSLLMGALADGIIAALGAIAWYAYQTEKR